MNSVYWVDEKDPELPMTVTCKHRYRQPDQHCALSKTADGHYVVDFDLPQRAITPGQSAVFYSGERCLGGGVIESTWI
jgi:tRNA-specific 2-thiouridylase